MILDQITQRIPFFPDQFEAGYRYGRNIGFRAGFLLGLAVGIATITTVVLIGHS